MANVEKILNYLGKHCRFTTLPTLVELKAGLDIDRFAAAEAGLEAQFIVPMAVPKAIKEKKLEQVKKIASHLWGGNDDIKRVFHKIDGMTCHELIYGRTNPLRVKVHFGNHTEKVFYAKELDEKRLFGIELEDILSEHKYNYSASGGAIYEDEVKGDEIYRLSNEARNDVSFLEEMAKLDYRAFLMLLKDLNPIANPHNCVVSKRTLREGYTYEVRPIDFDGLFEIEDFQEESVLSGQRDQVIDKLGKEKYTLLRALEKEGIKKRYCQNSERVNELLGVIGSSDECNTNVSRISCLLSKYYHDPKVRFYEAKNMGELLGMHLRAQLSN